MEQSPDRPAGKAPGPAADMHDLIRRVRRFALDFYHCVPRPTLWRAAALALLASLTEGIGLTLLAPLIALLGSGRPQSTLAANAARFLSTFGLPLSLPVLIGAFIGLVVFRTLVTGARDITTTRLQAMFVETLRIRLYERSARRNGRSLQRSASPVLRKR